MIENIQPTTSIRICFNPYNEMLMAYGDVDRIGRVIINLLGNAVKYAPASREIKVDAFKSEDAIIVTVKDERHWHSHRRTSKYFFTFLQSKRC